MVLAASTYRQTATYWGAPTQGGFGGLTFDAPITIKCRWEDIVEAFTDLAGVEHRSKAIVYTFRDLELGGYLMKGESVAADPTVVAGAMMIQRSDEIPDLRGLNTLYRTYL